HTRFSRDWSSDVCSSDLAEAKGSMEFIADFAFPLPVTVIAEILGVPASDQNKFGEWSRTMVDATTNPNMLKMVQHISALNGYLQIGRASCRERVMIVVVG